MAPQITVGGIHLVNSNGTPTPGGAATAASTTPFAIRRGWSLAAPEPLPIWQGGPPFRNGSGLVYSGYPNVTEVIPISVAGSSHENAVARLSELKVAITAVLRTAPVVMSVLPTSSSTIMYAEVYSAWVREVAESESGFEAWEGWSDIDAELIITRSPYFGSGSLTTLINGVTIGNVGTGATDNLESLGALTGDLVNEGSPINIKVVPGFNTTDYLIATVLARDFVETNEIVTGFTGTFQASTFGLTTLSAQCTTTFATIRANAGVRMRVLARIATITNPAKVRIRVRAEMNNGSAIYTGQVVSLPGVNTTGQLVDLGVVPLDIFRSSVIRGTDTLRINFNYASSDGTTTTFTFDYVEMLFYYDFCKVGTTPTASESLELLEAQNLSGGGWLPMVPVRAYSIDGTTLEMKRPLVIRGTPPRAFSGASLWLATTNESGHTRADTSTVTVTHAPLFFSLRGA